MLEPQSSSDSENDVVTDTEYSFVRESKFIATECKLDELFKFCPVCQKLVASSRLIKQPPETRIK